MKNMSQLLWFQKWLESFLNQKGSLVSLLLLEAQTWHCGAHCIPWQVQPILRSDWQILDLTMTSLPQP